jgi:hypothetical protein
MFVGPEEISAVGSFSFRIGSILLVFSLYPLCVHHKPDSLIDAAEMYMKLSGQTANVVDVPVPVGCYPWSCP